MEGTIKWFNDGKGYGFIISRGADYFVHRAHLHDKASLPVAGDSVSFDVEQVPRGPRAIRVKILARAAREVPRG